MNHTALPHDHAHACLIGRLWQPGLGATLVGITAEQVFDLSALAVTSSQLLEMREPAARVRQCIASGQAAVLAATGEVLANSDETRRQAQQPWFMAPCDLQAIKASGVTFVASMLERVIEEQARGDASRAEAVRQAVVAVIGDNLRSVQPGSPNRPSSKKSCWPKGCGPNTWRSALGPMPKFSPRPSP